MKISIPTPVNFSFNRTVLSHGWCTLLPCERDAESWRLRRVFDLGDKRPLSATISASKNVIEIEIPQTKLGLRSTQKITRDVRHMFRLDDDIMVAVLTNSLGREAVDGRRAFPSPDAMASAPNGFFRDEMRAGYRSPYFRELAERVASGTPDVESWLDSELPTEELKREIKVVKGVGDYAAENLLKLIGRYDGLALDSWLRARFADKHNNGRACSDKKIARHYARFKSWRGLALWCDMTKDWIEEEECGTCL